MAFYPYGEIKLMDNYELAKTYSWDLKSSLKLVEIEMHMKLKEFNDSILGVINDHSSEIENYEKFHSELFGRHKDEVGHDIETIDRELGDIPEEDEKAGGIEVLDQMKDKEVDYLDILMPNLNLPKLDPDGGHKKVQFSVKKTVSLYSDVISCISILKAQFLLF